MEYQIVTKTSPAALTTEVNNLLGDRWELQGGVVVAHPPEGVLYLQAVVRSPELPRAEAF